MYHLARRGVRVLGIDRFTPPHDRGSTHGHTRVIRQAYFEHADYVPLLRESYREWRELESRVARRLFYQIGLIGVGPPDGVVVPGVLRAAQEHRLGVEPLTPADVEARWPGLCVGNDLAAVFEPTAGYLLVDDCVQAHLDAAKACGAEFLFDTEVASWDAREDGVCVKTARGNEIYAQRLIIAAGAWAARILGDLHLALTVRRKSLFWFAADGDQVAHSKDMPVFLFEMPDGVFYGFPKLDDRGVKVAEHSGGRIVEDPLAVDRTVDAEEQRRLENFVLRHLPSVSKRVTDHAVCLYTMSLDEHFIVDRHPGHANVSFVAGLSGHGFKFAPVLGRVLADLSLDSATESPIDFLSLKRFEPGCG
jgi:monomeric sarcosine oxidase